MDSGQSSVISTEVWLNQVHSRTTRIGIIGLGYVGLPLALLFSEERFRVTGFDIDSAKVECLNAGKSYIHRIERGHIEAAQKNGFSATSEFSCIRDMDAVLICVPTPLHDDHTPDLSYVVSTMEAIAPHLRYGQLIVLESTTYPGTTEEIVVETINRHGKASGLLVQRDGPDAAQEIEGILVAFSPEREDPGNMMTPRREIPKVIGGVDKIATTAASALYGTVFNRTVLMSSPGAAEMTKLLENIYRCVNIALVNELKQLCIRMDINIWEVIEAASTKPFGFQAFYPGPGVGGHCIPVDPFYLSWKAQQHGFDSRFIALAGEVNEAMPDFVVETTARALEKRGIALAGSNIMVLGVAYKRDVDDLRESPSIIIIEKLLASGARVEYSDPFFPAIGRGRKYSLDMNSTPVAKGQDFLRFDCVLIATDHSTFNVADIVEHASLVVDTRNATRGIQSSKIVRC